MKLTVQIKSMHVEQSETTDRNSHVDIAVEQCDSIDSYN